jgi:hypothetical protein
MNCIYELHTTSSSKTFICTSNGTTTDPKQVVISRLRAGYTRATHSAVMDKEPSPECLICAVNLTTDHILWQCKETGTKRLQTGKKHKKKSGRAEDKKWKN